MPRSLYPLKWVAVGALIALAVVSLRPGGIVRRAWRRLQYGAPAGAGIVPGAGREASEIRNPEQYSRLDNLETVTLMPPEDVEPDAFRAAQRFLDVGGRAYSRKFNSAFSYRGDRGRPAPDVTVKWLKQAETFTGTLTVQGLKPNFAYQIKLLGDREDFTALERIGYLGRWSLPDEGPNISDRRYIRHPERQQAQSYLLFDFFVTDEHGAATKQFYADSSLHVMFHADRQRPPRPMDTAPLASVTRDPGDGIYANPDAVFGEERIYGEAESGSASGNHRPPIGRAFLKPGIYHAHIVLTEESFHWYGDGGNWATVLSAPVRFEIIEQ